MNIEEIALAIFLFIIFGFSLFVCRFVWKENRNLNRIANNIKPNSSYKMEARLFNEDNPFEEPSIVNIYIQEVRTNKKGIWWISYKTLHGTPKARELRKFLLDYKFVEDENTSVIHQE